jgi:hypothetical protein
MHPESTLTNCKADGVVGVHAASLALHTLLRSCLLRFDEVLKIQMHDIKVLVPETSISLTLPFRKTDQHGGACPADPVNTF